MSHHHHHDVGAPRPQDGSVLASIGPRDWSTYHPRPRWAPAFPHAAHAAFVLPLAADELFLVSRGALQSGVVRVAQSASHQHERGEIKVDVRIAYRDERTLAKACVCRLQKRGERHGVGVFTPSPPWTDPHDRLYVDILFTLPPAPSEGTPLRIKAFSTDTGNLGHELGDLWRSVLFDHLALTTSNARVCADAITLVKGSVRASNGAITGHFNVSDTLILHTSNAPIRATASLLNDRQDPTKLELRTSNGPIHSSISLTTPDPATGPSFSVQAHTSNGPLEIRYDDAPPGASLVSDARTSNSEAYVGMHASFEGRYEVSTTNARAEVRDLGAVDPTGMARRRSLERADRGGRVEGRVFWVGGAGAGGSSSIVHTSNGRASLDV